MSTPEHSKILYNKIKEHRVSIFAEIGVHVGNTLRHVITNKDNGLLEYWAIDHWLYDTGDYRTKFVENSDKYYNSVCELVKKIDDKDIVKIIRKASLDAVKDFSDEYFDMVFIDADHRYDAVLSDIKAWKPKVKKGGILCGHDFSKSWPGVKKAVTEMFGDCGVEMWGGSIWAVYI